MIKPHVLDLVLHFHIEQSGGHTKRDHLARGRGGSAGAPSVLIAYGPAMARDLKNCGIPGKFISLK